MLSRCLPSLPSEWQCSWPCPWTPSTTTPLIGSCRSSSRSIAASRPVLADWGQKDWRALRRLGCYSMAGRGWAAAWMRMGWIDCREVAGLPLDCSVVFQESRRSWDTPWSSWAFPCLHGERVTEDHLEHGRVWQHRLHHWVVVDHALHRWVFLHQLPKSIRVFQHLLHHSLVLRVVHQLFQLVGVDCAGNCAHVLWMVDHRIPSYSKWLGISQASAHACTWHCLFFRCEDLHDCIDTFFGSFLTLLTTTITVPPCNLALSAVALSGSIFPLKTNLMSVGSESYRSARSAV